jgi:hypothetical protein
LLFLNVGNTNRKIKRATPLIVWAALSVDGVSLAFSAKAVADIAANAIVAIIDFDNVFIFVDFGLRIIK